MPASLSNLPQPVPARYCLKSAVGISAVSRALGTACRGVFCCIQKVFILIRLTLFTSDLLVFTQDTVAGFDVLARGQVGRNQIRERKIKCCTWYHPSIYFKKDVQQFSFSWGSFTFQTIVHSYTKVRPQWVVPSPVLQMPSI